MTAYSFEGDKASRKLEEEQLKLLAESGYPKKAIELYIKRVNMGTLENPDVVTTYLGPCGDIIELYLKIDKAGIIKDGKFYYLGCPGSAASASAMIELVKGKTIDKAKKITEDDVLNALGGLPKTKFDCPKLAITTLRKAIAEYEKMKGRSEI
jgi:NifU-like protein involved in Fe-S cluster formation